MYHDAEVVTTVIVSFASGERNLVWWYHRVKQVRKILAAAVSLTSFW